MSKEGEELEILEGYKASNTIHEHIKSFYRQYESMKAHQEEIKNLIDLKISLGYPTTKRKGQIEPRTKTREDRATTRARAKRMEEVADVLKTKKLMTTVDLSHVKTMLKDLKGNETKKRQHEVTTQALACPSKRPKTRANR